eukprot:1371502-Rhodomonas_salina.1
MCEEGNTGRIYGKGDCAPCIRRFGSRRGGPMRMSRSRMPLVYAPYAYVSTTILEPYRYVSPRDSYSDTPVSTRTCRTCMAKSVVGYMVIRNTTHVSTRQFMPSLVSTRTGMALC